MLQRGVLDSGRILKSSSYNKIKLPSKAGDFISLSKFEKACIRDSSLSCEILNQTTENISSLENLVASRSLVTKILPSSLENSANFPFDNPLGLYVTSYPSDFKNNSSLFFTFSSTKNLLDGDGKLDIVFPSYDACSILQSRLNVLASKGDKVACEDFIYRNAGFKQLKNLPNHDARAFERGLPVANLAISDNVLVDFYSHEFRSTNEIYNSFGLRSVTEVEQDMREGKDVYFLDADGGALNVKSIEKVPISEMTFTDLQNILRIVREKQGKKPTKAYLCVMPFEVVHFDAAMFSKRLGIQVNVFTVNDPKKFDPEGKASKAKPGKPGIYVAIE